MNRLHMYCGASPLTDLKAMMLDSLLISSSMVFQAKLQCVQPVFHYVVFRQQYLVNLVLFRTRPCGGAGVVVVG